MSNLCKKCAEALNKEKDFDVEKLYDLLIKDKPNYNVEKNIGFTVYFEPCTNCKIEAVTKINDKLHVRINNTWFEF